MKLNRNLKNGTDTLLGCVWLYYCVIFQIPNWEESMVFPEAKILNCLHQCKFVSLLLSSVDGNIVKGNL